MGRKCMTCQHASYQKINRLLVEGRTPLSSISRQYGMSVDSLRNHMQRCIHTNLIRAQQKRDNDYAEELWGVFKKSVTRLANNVDDLEDVIAQTKKRKHYSTLIKALGETRSTLELAYKMMVSITATQRAEEDIEWVLHDPRLNEILHDLSTPELAVFRKVISKLVDRTSRPMIEIQSVGDMGGKGEGTLAEDNDEGEDEDNYESLMVRTRFPKGEGKDIADDKPPQSNSRDQLNGSEADHEDDGVDMDKPDREGLTQRQRERKRPWHEIAW